ncbi:cytosine/adenosine deaminase-related metal-dependent hydrolase [Ancylobacter aquaticus]|uniref:Cytosine/adenosine deaminase-related metal-dependent hydrolase n=1 Tax=Ancylobacter aquaticus TaxID=100 RepID=A0A4R1HM29_ANCAQ|nr:amidohydrolase family protein [Ancylobacter aquaticus]TCK23527.1 cytosine/adenosine deaminase-related metal-dependent hydrolase [Ancylobacter aquaticus]
MAELIVQARWVVTGIKDRHTPVVIEDGAVLSRDGVIVAVGASDAMQKLAPAAEVKSYPNHAMLPGFVNSHHHVGLTPLQLGSPDYALELWFAGRMPARKVDLYLDTLYSAFEMIASGVTTVQHIHGWMSGGYEAVHGASTKVLNAYRTLGMRASYCYAVREQNRLVYEADQDFCARLPAPLGTKLAAHLTSQALPFDDFMRLFDQLSDENVGQTLTRIQLAPANLHWCTDDGLLALNEKATARGVPMHMHLLETAYQKEYARRRTGKTALRHLYDLGILGPHMTLGHGVWLNGEDIDIVADTGTCICHNCSSNFRLRSGLAPLNVWEAKGITVGLGLDEAGINDDRDMLSELRLALRVHRTPGMDDDDVPTCAQVVKMATEAGGMTTAFGAEIGRLDPGRFFDAALINWTTATYPFQDPDIPMLDALVQRAKTGAVDAVFINGEIVYQDGRFTTIDRDAVLAEIADILGKPRSPEEVERRELGLAVFPHVKKFYEGYIPDEPREPFYAASARV